MSCDTPWYHRPVPKKSITGLKAGRLPRSFFARDARRVARDLLGAVLVRRFPSGQLRLGRIVETEAYGGRGDRASHAFRGRTRRNAVMFGPPGHAYVYFTYGMHWLLNVVTGKKGEPAAVLIREIELVESDDSQRTTRLDGPARLTKAFRITGSLNGEDLITSRRLWILPRDTARPRRIVRTPRIGVDYAGHAATWRRRFVLCLKKTGGPRGRTPFKPRA